MIYSNEEIELFNLDDLRKGDIWVILSPKTTIKHYVLYIGDCLIIHNKTNHNWNWFDDGVTLDKVCNLDKYYENRDKLKKKYYVRRYLGTDEQFHEILKRAWAMLGQKEFSYLFNNCEHFINTVTLGISESKQVQDYTLNILKG